MRSHPSSADRALPISRSRTRDSSHAAANERTAVLIDGSAVYLSARTLHEGKQLDYRAIVTHLTQKVPGLSPPTARADSDRWVMWTSASPENAGQSRFLDFVEDELNWTVRRFS